MKILIVKMSAIGDVIHTLPALVALRRQYPRAEITWLVEEPSVSLLEGHPDLNRVLLWERRRFTRLFRAGRWFAAARLLSGFIRALRDTRYDLLVDFQALLKSSLWIALARAKRKVGFGPGMDHAEGSHWFLNERIPAVSMEVHALDRGLKLLEGMGGTQSQVDYHLEPNSDDAAKARALVGRVGEEDRPLVAINPMARWSTKLWDTPRFGEVADRLIDAGCRVVFTGSAEDGAAIDGCCEAMSHSAVRCEGRTDLRTLMAIYREAAVVITTDTGPMHLAAAVGTPVVALFGPTSPGRTGPHGSGHIVLRAGLSCSPCFERSCRTTKYAPRACMHQIRVEQVVDAALRILEEKSADSQAGGS